MSEGTVLDALGDRILASAEHPAQAEVGPDAILWPDETRQWRAAAEALRSRLAVVELGSYAEAAWRGPAYWVRCVVDDLIEGPVPGITVAYLPGYGRSDVRAVEEAPSALKPLAELQYRGALFSQKSGRDWTWLAFLQAPDARGGLGIDVANDDATKAALLKASGRLLQEPVANLRRAAPLRAAYFLELMTPNIDRDVLRWLDDPGAFRDSVTANEWTMFQQRFAERFGLELTAGEVEVAYALGVHATDAWSQVWQAFGDAPDRYPNVAARLHAAGAKARKQKRVKEQESLWDDRGAWPQDNDEAEADLRAALIALPGLSPSDARARTLELETAAALQRTWVWARLGDAPLAGSMRYLRTVADGTSVNVSPGPLSAIVDDYATRGWTVDDAVMRALAEVSDAPDVEAVSAAISAMYTQWLELGAERMAAAVAIASNDYVAKDLDDWPVGTCVLFVDGLRLDVGHRLAGSLSSAGVAADVQPRLTALPSITPTAKPAASPAIRRLAPGSVFGVRAKAGATDLSADGLRKEIEDAGYAAIESDTTGDPVGRGWTEQGDIDQLGHKYQAGLPGLLDTEVKKLSVRIRELLDAGWNQVVVVTDHGWLYLPGGLPKADLPINATKDGGARKGRAARIADGAVVEVQVVPWYWDPEVRIAVAPGIRSFLGSPVYEHGGISPQECVTPVVIARASEGPDLSASVRTTWEGLRLRVVAPNAASGRSADIRARAGDPGSTMCDGGRPFDDGGKASLIVEDGDLIGSTAQLVILDEEGVVRSQEEIIIGGDE